MSVTLNLNEAAVFTSLRGFLLSILPAGVPVIRAYANRVPEPGAADFVLMSQLTDRRISTNIDVPADCAFTGTIAGTQMTVTAVAFGTIEIGAPVFGPTVAPGTAVIAYGPNTSGGPGTYTLSIGQTVASQKLAAGLMQITEGIDFAVQLDVHGPNASDNVRKISALMRDEFATDYFDGLGLPIAPLYADDPRYMPFTNDQNQYEYRWVVDAHLQIDPTVSVPQQFFDTITLKMYEIDGATIFALWGTNVAGQVVGTNVPFQAVATGVSEIPTATVTI